ncbi:LysR family transcriptional regulator [Kineococcus sp. TBRC 1896]|uniref:LysR family transcriptional regulator n=1 Tax=Kineococcus mangrovi TaxID=1660183 RepID=A0ABV4IAN3_9ACTN
MDVVAGCRAFLAVATRGSFTAGAASVRIPQSVASRRVAALEAHLGGRLLERSSRTVAVTSLGRDLLPTARRLVDLADTLVADAERARRRPVRCGVPDTLDLAALARFAARTAHVVDPVPLPRARRVEAVRDRDLPVALVPVPADEAEWTTPLGVAARPGVVRAHAVRLATLRRGRTRGSEAPRRCWLLPEDDVPHVRDVLVRAAEAAGLQPVQVGVAPTPVAALARVLDGDDLVLATRAQARAWGLDWRPLAGPDLVRGLAVLAGRDEDARRLRAQFAGAVADLCEEA